MKLWKIIPATIVMLTLLAALCACGEKKKSRSLREAAQQLNRHKIPALAWIS